MSNINFSFSKILILYVFLFFVFNKNIFAQESSDIEFLSEKERIRIVTYFLKSYPVKYGEILRGPLTDQERRWSAKSEFMTAMNCIMNVIQLTPGFDRPSVITPEIVDKLIEKYKENKNISDILNEYKEVLKKPDFNITEKNITNENNLEEISLTERWKSLLLNISFSPPSISNKNIEKLLTYILKLKGKFQKDKDSYEGDYPDLIIELAITNQKNLTEIPIITDDKNISENMFYLSFADNNLISFNFLNCSDGVSIDLSGNEKLKLNNDQIHSLYNLGYKKEQSNDFLRLKKDVWVGLEGTDYANIEKIYVIYCFLQQIINFTSINRSDISVWLSYIEGIEILFKYLFSRQLSSLEHLFFKDLFFKKNQLNRTVNAAKKYFEEHKQVILDSFDTYKESYNFFINEAKNKFEEKIETKEERIRRAEANKAAKIKEEERLKREDEQEKAATTIQRTTRKFLERKHEQEQLRILLEELNEKIKNGITPENRNLEEIKKELITKLEEYTKNTKDNSLKNKLIELANNFNNLVNLILKNQIEKNTELNFLTENPITKIKNLKYLMHFAIMANDPNLNHSEKTSVIKIKLLELVGKPYSLKNINDWNNIKYFSDINPQNITELLKPIPTILKTEISNYIEDQRKDKNISGETKLKITDNAYQKIISTKYDPALDIEKIFNEEIQNQIKE
ncbi:MAG: hypothetical protein ABIA74_06240 [bacterium]